MKHRTISLLALLFTTALLPAASHEADVIVYGGTSASVIAAVQVKKMGRTVIMVSPDERLGGLSSGGLGWTDTGNKAVIGGLSRDFYQRIYKHYEDDAAWKWQERKEYGNTGQGTPAIDGEQRTMWIFEPSAAKGVFEDYIKEFGIPLHRGALLDREKGVKTEDGRITSITTLDGDTFTGNVFLDTTYEGDLMAAAGVKYTVGREGKADYGEEWAGVRT